MTVTTMPISLRVMKAEEFPAYRDYFIADYAAEIAATYGHTLAKGHAIAAQELADDLPQTVATPENYLLCIDKGDAELVGYLWYRLLDNGGTAFIFDFFVSEEFRGQGYGKAALLAVEEQLTHADVEQIKLRVAFENKRALRLYERLGFNITGFNIAKTLGA